MLDLTPEEIKFLLWLISKLQFSVDTPQQVIESARQAKSKLAAALPPKE